ncbi:MAG: extracellular solute-binding protein [Christensenellales bacterium]|jgi:putative aldouronate transport system substrate-binding protein
MKRNLVFLCIALCLLISSTIAETSNLNIEAGMPVVDEPLDVTITVFAQGGAQDFKAENNWMCQYIDKYSGLNIEWMVVDSSSALERLSLMLNSGDMPDAIIGYSFSANDIVQYAVSDGLFYPINTLLEYAPTFNKYLEDNPAVKAAITTPDGNIYGFPALPNLWSYKIRFFVNTKWLDNVGLKNPTTLDELKEMLIAFRDKDANGNGDPTDEIPWAGSWNQGNSERALMFLAKGYVQDGTGNVAIDYNGNEPQIVYVPYEEGYKEFLIFMNDLWNEKLLDLDMFTQAETQVQANVLEGKVGFCGQSAPYVYDPENQDDWIALNALVDNIGDKPVYPGPSTVYSMSRYAINADCDEKKAAALAGLADFFYTLEGWGFATFGPEANTELDWNGTGHYYDVESNTIKYNMPDDMTSAWIHRITNLTIYSNPGFNAEGYDPYRLKYAEEYPESAIGQQYKNGVVARKDEIEQQQAYSPYYVESVPSLFFSGEDMARITELEIPLKDYVDSMEAKFITGEASIENDYDTFIATLESYGVKEYIDIYTKYYNDYKSR